MTFETDFLNKVEVLSEMIIENVATGLAIAFKKWLKYDEKKAMGELYRRNEKCKPKMDLKSLDYKISRVYHDGVEYQPCWFFRRGGVCGRCNF